VRYLSAKALSCPYDSSPLRIRSGQAAIAVGEDCCSLLCTGYFTVQLLAIIPTKTIIIKKDGFQC